MENITILEKQERELELRKQKFELQQREAKALSVSAFFPTALKGDVASAVIIHDLSNRMKISVLEVAQSIYIIHNKPSFSTTFMVARLNQSGLIKGALRCIISSDKQNCYASAIDAETGEELKGMTVTMDIAKAEGWLSKSGSKWKTMPELMLRKRAQSFFIKEFYPEVLFGLQSSEELSDVVDVEYSQSVKVQESKTNEVNAMLLDKPQQKEEIKEVVENEVDEVEIIDDDEDIPIPDDGDFK